MVKRRPENRRFPEKRFLSRMYLLLIISYCVFGCSSPALSRTVTMVYDDSLSMSGHGKWGYANYAAQSLAALLGPEDKLFVVKMSRPFAQQIEKISIKGEKNKQKSVRNIRRQWREGKNTPYQAVRVAIDHCIAAVKNRRRRIRPAAALGNDWLIIMTDGKFDGNDRGNRDIKRLMAETKGRVRVVFFLIGDDADRALPETWRQVMPIDVFQAGGQADEIIDSMGQIAALISGWDKKPVKKVIKRGDPKILQFSSPFPIKKIILLEQRADGGRLNTLNKMTVNGSAVQVGITAVDIKTPSAPGVKQIKGRVSMIQGAAVTASGSYDLVFKYPVQSRDLQVLVKTAIDFSVVLQGRSGKPLLPTSGNRYQVCSGDDLKVRASFFKNGGKNPMLLDHIASGLTVRGNLAGQEFGFVLSPDRYAMEADLKNYHGDKSLSVASRYPGYFQFKSNILTIDAEHCSVTASLRSAAKRPIPLPYIWSDTMIKGAAARLIFAGDEPDGNYTLSFTGLPSGIAFRIRGHIVDRQHPQRELRIKHGATISVDILRDKNFREQAPFKVIVRAATTHRNVRWVQDKTALSIKPVPRRICGVIGNVPWSAPVNNLAGRRPLQVRVMVDGSPVGGEEWPKWSVGTEEKGIRMKISRDERTQQFLLAPEAAWGCDCFTATGVIPVRLRLDGPFPGDHIEIPAQLTISDVHWWLKCRTLILCVFFGLLFAWYLLRLLRKNRFASNAFIDYREFIIGHTTPRRKNTEQLAGPWYSRILLPTSAEVKTVEGITFRAGESSGYILLPGKQQTENMIIDGEELDYSGRDDKRINSNCRLEKTEGKRRKIYEYSGS